MHHGVAHQDDAFDGRLLEAGGGDHAAYQRADPLTDDGRELPSPRLFEGELGAAHDVAAVGGLRVQRGMAGPNPARLEVDELGHHGGGAEVHRHAEARPRLEVEGGVVGQDGDLKLLHLERDRLLRNASDTPAASPAPAPRRRGSTLRRV